MILFVFYLYCKFYFNEQDDDRESNGLNLSNCTYSYSNVTSFTASPSPTTRSIFKKDKSMLPAVCEDKIVPSVKDIC